VERTGRQRDGGTAGWLPLIAVAALVAVGGLACGEVDDLDGALAPRDQLVLPRGPVTLAPQVPPTDPTPPTGSDSGVPAPAPPPPPIPDSVTVNVGINRDIVPGYPGDACGGVANLLVIDAIAPGGDHLEHMELDCRGGGYNGWTYFDQPAGTYVATLQLFDVDAYGIRTAVTPARVGRGDLRSGGGLVIWVDFTYHDFLQPITGNLKWRVGWLGATEPGIEVGCEWAQPEVVTQRITVRDDQGRLVDGWAGGPAGFVRADGSATGPCSTYGPSDAQVVSALPWGVYEVTVEGLDASGGVAYCSRRDLFSPQGDGIIFHLTATKGPCAGD
jgi:hypothetical protein